MKTLVLMYHNVVNSDNGLHLYDVSLDNLKKQMTIIKSPGHQVTKSPGHKVTRTQSCKDTRTKLYPLNANLRGTRYALRDTILTFDDGYKSWAQEVLDILNEAGLKAYFFVCMEFIKNGSISKEDIVKLKNNGMVIGSHGMKHRFLHKLSNRELFYELGESKKALEDIIQDEVKHFSIPRGVHNKKILKIAKDLGYKHIFTSDIGINRKNEFALKRIPIKRDVSLEAFQDIISGKSIRVMVFSQKIRDKAKKSLGIGVYNLIRRILVTKAE